jgi:CHAT domain-containing protein
MPVSEALAEAKAWLSRLTIEHTEQLIESWGGATATESEFLNLQARLNVRRPFEPPRFWAGFVLIGDPA